MRRWVKSFTYQPKINGVRNGSINQTMRLGNEVRVGDEILFHGWSGRPYRSKWDWRLRVVVTEAIPIMFNYHYINIGLGGIIYGKGYSWSDEEINELARRDGIAPCKKDNGEEMVESPLGECLRNVIYRMNWMSLRRKVRDGQIIRWKVKE